MNSNFEQDHDFLKNALEKYPQGVAVLNLEPFIVDSARGRGEKPGYVKLALPDEMIKNLRGDPKMRDAFFLTIVSRDVRERSESPIILPGELTR